MFDCGLEERLLQKIKLEVKSLLPIFYGHNILCATGAFKFIEFGISFILYNCRWYRNILFVARLQLLSEVLHRNLPRNNRIWGAIFPLFMNSTPNGDGPHQ